MDFIRSLFQPPRLYFTVAALLVIGYWYWSKKQAQAGAAPTSKGQGKKGKGGRRYKQSGYQPMGA